MKYLAVDIETTGIDENWCQILEIAAVLADTLDLATPAEDLPAWSCRLYYDRVVGQPYALWLNASLILDMERREAHHNYLHPDSVWSHLNIWLEGHGLRDERLTLSGKNLGTFDLRFLCRLPRWNRERFRHRVLDPGSLFLLPTDACLPDLHACAIRAGIPWDAGKHHTALEDARTVVRLNNAALAAKWRESP